MDKRNHISKLQADGKWPPLTLQGSFLKWEACWNFSFQQSVFQASPYHHLGWQGRCLGSEQLLQLSRATTSTTFLQAPWGWGWLRGCCLLPFQLLLSLGLELLLTASSCPCGRQGPHAWHQQRPSPPACLSSWFTWRSPTCIRGSSCNLLLTSPCSVAGPHSFHDLRSCFQLPKPSRSQSSCSAQGWV